MILLDTDIFTLLVTGHPEVTRRAAARSAEIAITVVTRIEVLQGRFDSLMKAADAEELQRAHQRLVASERDLGKLRTVGIDAATAHRFHELRAQKKLRKIGRADVLIASIALAQNATLVTRNLRHFRQVPSLKIENWAD
jgi:tRNA(fMet)-specific endonuclease VapC